MPSPTPSPIHSGLALWRALTEELTPEHQRTLQGWLQGEHPGWCAQAQQDLPTWPPRQRLVAVVTLQRAFVHDSNRNARIVAENTMSRAPLPDDLRPALPWGMLAEGVPFPFQLSDILRILDAWSADATDAVVASLQTMPGHRAMLFAWLGSRAPRADILGALADGLSDKKARVVSACADALAAYGDEAVAHVTPRLGAKTAGTRRAAAEILGRIGSSSAIGPLRAALAAERSQKTRDALAEAIQRCGSSLLA